jgi:hypothetical protein
LTLESGALNTSSSNGESLCQNEIKLQNQNIVNTPDQMRYFDSQPNDIFQRPTKNHSRLRTKGHIFGARQNYYILMPDQMIYF